MIITEVGLQRILYDAIYVAGSKKLRLLQVGVVHVPNKTDIPKALIDRMKDNQRIIGGKSWKY